MERSGSGQEAIVAMRKQLTGLQIELTTLSSDYDQALRRVKELEAALFDLTSGQAGEQTAQIMEGLASREQYYRKQAETWARASRVLEQEMQTASSLQRLLFPHALPRDTPGVECAASHSSASKTSGDLYGVRDRTDRHELTLFIADATGHGLPAALITAGVFGAMQLLELIGGGARAVDAALSACGVHPDRFHSAIRALCEPARSLAILDHIVGDMGHRKFAMTLFSASFDYHLFRLRYANAGHCFPLLVRLGKASSLHHSSAQLGLASEAEHQWQQYEIPIHDGDILFMYTDGLLEARNARDHAVGARRLAAWLETLHAQPADIIRDGVRSRLDHFVGSVPIDDDVTFLVVKFHR